MQIPIMKTGNSKGIRTSMTLHTYLTFRLFGCSTVRLFKNYTHMQTLVNTLKQRGVLVSDGAWGTFLQNMGLKAGECPELWNADHPSKVLQIARDYVNAGADMIETNSFGGNRLKLGAYSMQHRTVELNTKAAQISKEAAGDQIFVLGSIGPTGKMLIMGNTSQEELYDVFAEQAGALAQGGADALIIETMSDLEEACIAIRAARETTGIEVICTMTFSKTQSGTYRTMMGISPEEMVVATVEAGADIIGANCGNGMEEMIALIKDIRSLDQQIPLLVQANAGLPAFNDGQTIYDETPAAMASKVEELIMAGANIIGGCCGTTPEHIKALRQAIGKKGFV